MRRDDVRAALLVLLDEQPHTGESLMEEIERRSSVAWRPGPGPVHPTLEHQYANVEPLEMRVGHHSWSQRPGT